MTWKYFMRLIKRSKVTVNTPFGEKEKIEIQEIIKKGTTYEPVMCCAITGRVNDIREQFCCNYGGTGIRMPIFMDNISA